MRYLAYVYCPGCSLLLTRDKQGVERLRLWVDHLLLIDQWSSLTTAEPTAALPLGSPGSSRSLYDLSLEFKGAANSSHAQASNFSLRWSFSQSPYSSTPPSASDPVPSISYNPQPIVSEHLMHSYALSLPTSAGPGLSATYYGGCTNASSSFDPAPLVAWDTPQKAVVQASLDWSSAASDNGGPYAACVAQQGAFAARWHGFVAPSVQAVYTFRAVLHGSADTAERIQLWVDNQAVIAQWTSLGASQPSGTVRIDSGEGLYAVKLEYKTGLQTNRGVSLQWQTLGRDGAPSLSGPDLSSAGSSANDSTAAAVPSEAPADADYPFTFMATQRARRREPAGGATGEVTLGVIDAFHLRQPQTSSIVTRDDFEEWDTDTYDASQPLLSNPQQRRRGVWSVTGGCPAQAGTAAYDRCRGRGTAVNDALRVEVKAGALCAGKTTTAGAALTVGTAGVSRTFTLTARDAYDNVRDALDDSFVAQATLDVEQLRTVSASSGSALSSTIAPGHSKTTVSARLEPQTYAQLVLEGSTNLPPSDAGGRYEGIYTATVSGTYHFKVDAVDAQAHGLIGSYMPGLQREYQGEQRRVDSNLDFNWGLSSPAVNVPAGGGSWRAVWHGFLEPLSSASHIFYLETDGSATGWCRYGPAASIWSGGFCIRSR